MPDWPELIKHYGPLVWKSVYRLVGNEADASDCFQETFLRTLKYVQNHTVTRWPGLLQRIATQSALDRLRERIRVSQRHDGDVDWSIIPGAQVSPSERVIQAELACRLRAGLSRLPAAQAEVFVLCQLHGLSYQEVADLMGMQANGVGVLLHRARGGLAEVLSENATSQARCTNAQRE